MSKATPAIDSTLLEHTGCDIFTPEWVARMMAGFLGQRGTLLEPSCGTGELLKAVDLTQYNRIDLFDIKAPYLDRIPDRPNQSKQVGDFLTLEIPIEYDNILMNPPYIRAQDLSPEYRKGLQTRWPGVLNSGSIDIYYAFLLRALEVLRDDGVLVAITPNSYLYNKSARALREHLIQNRYISRILDFGSSRVFDDVVINCCISVFTKHPKESFEYSRYNRTTLLDTREIQYDRIRNANLFESTVEDSKCGAQSIGDVCHVSNGIATICDSVFIHATRLFDEPCWEPVYCGNDKVQWAIFPYEDGRIIPEDRFERANPATYVYLCQNRERLAQRDHGNRSYSAWYAYGRTQAIQRPNAEQALFVPSLVNPTNIAVRIRPVTLYKNCICITVREDSGENEVDVLQRVQATILHSAPLLEQQCVKRNTGWITLNTTILKTLLLV